MTTGSKTKLSVTISSGLRRDLEQWHEDKLHARSVYRRHTLSEDVEELLRTALKAKASDNNVLVQFDDGLWAWVKAYVNGVALAGSIEDTIIYFVRQGILKASSTKRGDGLLKAMLPHLPPSIQKAMAR